MRFISAILLSLLASKGRAKDFKNPKIPLSRTTSNSLNCDGDECFEFRNVPLTANIKVIDDYNGDVLSITNGPSGDIIEIKDGEANPWYFEHLTAATHIIRDSKSTRFIHFPELKDGAVATFSETAATLFEVIFSPNAVFNISASYTEGDGILAWTTEPYSTNDSRMVLKLRKWASGKGRQEYVMATVPKTG
ncbi:uncharacterized protein GIQ15_01662 [Arthroderma uncinatum]|uniref:uncharacterized protein n=1 Tax=Arthroderma uncinatum TaxID=74035 RepID=UPI00144A7918|nr:uncharacterized protein GIQ15_01662 [Arthroderma uncinatum]KAF3492145.1 hypothetical protein GIQ15_01662 [Arthroderma uncinatum]